MKIYLAIPYTGTENESFKFANQMASYLMREGHIVFSPISMTHPIACENELPKDWGFWESNDSAFISWCDEVWICDFGDWQSSKGVCAEIEIANKLEKPVRFL